MTDSSFQPFEVLSTEVLCDRPYAYVEHQRVRLPNGSEADWYIQGHGWRVGCVIALTSDQQLIAIRSYKHGAGRAVWELPTGVIDPDEDAMIGTERELLEETGYASRDWVKLGEYWSNPTSGHGKKYLFQARDCILKQPQQLDDAEQIEVHLFDSVDVFLEHLRTTREDVAESCLAALALYRRD